MIPDSQLQTHVSFMHRCLELAKLGDGYVNPNPMVGAVLVYNGKIIGEGYHQKYGEAHAEVNCLNSVSEENKKLISKSTLYVSLEPCSHFGKTPPCSDLIIKNKIRKVVFGCRDPNFDVSGGGSEKLEAAGVDVEFGILENECKEINKRFFTFFSKHRPYIILKWAQSANNKIAAKDSDRIFISNEQTNRLVHKWRSEEAAILVGTNTALMDDPALTTRHWHGGSPIRLIVDMNLRLPPGLKVFDKSQRTIVFNAQKNEEEENLLFYKINREDDLVTQLVQAMFKLNIQSVLVEGGARLLQSFIDNEMWDEMRVIKNESLIIENGLDTPKMPAITAKEETKILGDIVNTYFRS